MKREVIAEREKGAAASIFEHIYAGEPIQIGRVSMNIMGNKNVWMEIEDEEGSEFPLKDIEKLLLNYFNKNF